MKTKITILLISLMLCQTSIFAQQNTTKEIAINFPQENVYLHFNSATLLVGEQLYYRLYCLNSTTEHLSSLSKIAYVELIGENKKVVFKQKIKLINGLGQGDFKIPADVASGNYKIIGYTQWMRNSGEKNLFHDNITILNPYSADQQIFLQKKDSKWINTSVEQLKQKTITSPFLKMELIKSTYGKRAKVSLNLTANSAKNKNGSYSVSVRKVDAIDALQHQKITSVFFKKGKKVNTFKDVLFLPELRGEIISGVLVNKKNNQPAPNEKMSLSIQQKDFILKISTTNANGRFYFNLNDDYSSKTAVVQVLNKMNDAFKIVFDRHASVSVDDLSFGEFRISKKYSDEILSRSIYNQIENSYSSVKKDGIIDVEQVAPFFGKYHDVYELDDFTRFPTVKETFIEIIESASIVKTDKDEFEFYVESLDPYLKNKEMTAVIVDGVLQQNKSKIIEYDSRKIKKISVARTETKFVIGTKLYEGFIVMETFKGDFNKKLASDSFMVLPLFKPQPKKKYFKKEYAGKEVDVRNNIPDFRNQLLWEPMVNMRTQKVALDFFTSDNIGVYEISLEGFTANGEPVTLKEYITVE